MRIIGGTLKKKRLSPVRGKEIRPTADRLRETIFNILAFGIRDAVVLDLFAGTGAMGIEALSRQAASAVFVDQSTAALATIRKNIAACKLAHCSRVIRWDAAKNLDCLSLRKERFSLVFIDPPYNRGLIAPAVFHLHQSGALATGARLVVEHTPAEPIDVDGRDRLPAGAFRAVDQRRYGKTLVSFFEYML
jgi:16S rRNA (guanine966-N2)-methyltransferase